MAGGMSSLQISRERQGVLRYRHGAAEHQDCFAVAKRLVIKLGGSVLSAPNAVLNDIACLHSAGTEICIVHGGGPDISRELAKKGITSQFVQGLRVTSLEVLQTVEEQLAAINSNVVSRLLQLGTDASGILVGVACQKQMVKSSDSELIDIGFVGAVKEVYAEEIDHCFSRHFIPVLTPIGTDAYGQHYNINADEVAMSVALALKADVLVYLTDVPGIKDGAGTPIAEIDPSGIERLISAGIIAGGMIPKARSCANGVSQGLGEVMILSPQKDGQLLQALIGKDASGSVQPVDCVGTKIVAQSCAD